MNDSNGILQNLINLCRENEILPDDLVINGDDDLFEYGVIDSMGLTLLTCIIEENFKLELSPEILIAELRTPRAIADYISNHQHSVTVAV